MTGVGEGLTDWLSEKIGRQFVTGFKFSARSKAQLGSSFLALVETGRFQYWQSEHEFDDAWWFYTQAKYCTYDLPPGAQFERDLRWFVPNTAMVSTPAGNTAVHDDRLLSAALTAEADRLIKNGDITLGVARSFVSNAPDPFADMEF